VFGEGINGADAFYIVAISKSFVMIDYTITMMSSTFVKYQLVEVLLLALETKVTLLARASIKLPGREVDLEKHSYCLLITRLNVMCLLL
jgi:hypothetical protein